MPHFIDPSLILAGAALQRCDQESFIEITGLFSPQLKQDSSEPPANREFRRIASSAQEVTNTTKPNAHQDQGDHFQFESIE